MGSKRKSDTLSPPINEVQKRYSWSPEELIKQNRFHPLTLQDTTDGTQDNDNANTSQGRTENQNEYKTPPIFLHNASTINHREIINDIKKIAQSDFTTEYKSKYLKVNLNSHDDYRLLTKFYTENQVEFHSFQNPKDKPLSVVIKDVPISLTNDEILEELRAKELPVVSVTRLLNKEKKPIPICAVILTAKEISNEIYNLTYLSHSKVTVENRRKASNIPQCHKCQNYGHTKNYCSVKPRCIKCKEDHQPNECRKRPTDPPVCVNCGGNHPANYRGCPHHIKLQNQRPPIRSTNKTYLHSSTNATNTNQNPPKMNSYAQVTNSSNDSQRQANQPSSSSSSNSLFETILQFLKQLIIPHLPQIKSFIMNHILPNLFNG